MILDELAAYARQRTAEAKQAIDMETIKTRAYEMPLREFRFERALQDGALSLICEVKKASPSKGIISEDFPYLDIAREYTAGGASCISCLTEPKWFLGSDKIFSDIREAVSLPMLRKDFVVDEYQIYEAKCLGADAVLLICSLLDAKTVQRYLAICDSLGLSALVETHDADEIRSAVDAGARVIGVNNRNLKDFSVDHGNAGKLRKLIPPSALFVAESGIQTPADVAAMRTAGADAALIGEALMRAYSIQDMLASFLEAAQ